MRQMTTVRTTVVPFLFFNYREMMILLENLDARRLIHSSIIRGDDDETWSVKLPSIDPENGRSVSSPIILRIHDLVNVMFYLSG
jgi:hypothetical protein